MCKNLFAAKRLKQGLSTGPTPIENTNFDWEYYVAHNNLSEIQCEQAAYEHYLHYGKDQQLSYCKRFVVVATLHLYEHIFERSFGYVFESLEFKTLCLNYMPRGCTSCYDAP
jgi:hypothetical protein